MRCSRPLEVCFICSPPAAKYLAHSSLGPTTPLTVRSENIATVLPLLYQLMSYLAHFCCTDDLSSNSLKSLYFASFGAAEPKLEVVEREQQLLLSSPCCLKPRRTWPTQNSSITY